MSNPLIFIDFPDPDNFLSVLYCAKQIKDGEYIDIVTACRPTNLSYAPFYPKELMQKFNVNDFIFPIDNEESENIIKKKYPGFEKWFNIDKVNKEDTELIFDINIIRLNKFLLSELKNKKINIRIFKSENNIPNLGMRHHFHKMEWSYDLEESKLDIILNKIIDNWKNEKISISEKYRIEIINLLNKYKELNKKYIIEIHNFSELNKQYDVFLVGGPFTDVKEIIKEKYTNFNKIIAMDSAIYTGTSNKNKANIFPDQFNNYVDPNAASFVLSQNIPIILVPTETTKPWKKYENNYALTFTSSNILSWGDNICNLFKSYNGKNSLDDPSKEHAIFDLIISIYYYNNIKINNNIKKKIHKIYKNKKTKQIIIECDDNINIIIKKDLETIWEGSNKYIIVGNLEIENQEDKRLLKIKTKFTKLANKSLGDETKRKGIFNKLPIKIKKYKKSKIGQCTGF